MIEALEGDRAYGHVILVTADAVVLDNVTGRRQSFKINVSHARRSADPRAASREHCDRCSSGNAGAYRERYGTQVASEFL